MSRYKTTSGEWISKSTIDFRIRDAKAKAISRQLDEHGYNFCELDAKEHSGHLTCMHWESVDYCQKNGHSEKAYDINNIVIACTKCHAIYDKNDVKLNFNK